MNDRRVINGILHVLKTGCCWRDMHAGYGLATTAHNRCNRWSQHGLWQRLFKRIAASGEVSTELLIGSTHAKAQRSAVGGKGGEWALAVGLSRGGRTSKVHCLADHRGRPPSR